MTETSVAATLVGDRAVIRAIGEFDTYSAPQLYSCLLEQIAAGHRHLVVDLSEISFMDSSALGVLVGALKRVRVDGGTVRLVCPNDRLAKSLRITGLTKVLPIDATLEAALAP